MAPIPLEDIVKRLWVTHRVCLPRYELMAFALAHQRPCTCLAICEHKWSRMQRTCRAWGPKTVHDVTQQMVRERARHHWNLVRKRTRASRREC